MATMTQVLMIIGLAMVAPAAAGDTVVRQRGVSETLAALSNNALALNAARLPDAGVRSVTADMRGTPRKLAPGGQPLHAHPAAVATPGPGYVNTGGTQINMDGMAAGAGAAGLSGAVGEQHYVQVAGAALAVYRKHDGGLQLGPVSVHALFAGAGLAPCSVPGGGPASVLYDQLEKRWLISWLAGAPGQHVQCIAISTTADPLGSYYRYAMQIDGAGAQALQAEDARSALWPDAYLFTFTLFDNAHGSYRGPRICAIERLALVRGRDAALHCKDPGPAFGPAVAATLEGNAAPPKGTPAPILSLDFTVGGHGARLLLWRFAFSSASIGAPVALAVEPFRTACADLASAACIGQPSPGTALFVPGDRLMPRAAYRHDAGRETLVLAHAVQQDDGRTGLRWYEVRDPARNLSSAVHLYQQGTHAPDPDHRAMGSMGIDRAGNIALGYSVAGATTPPGVRYTGRQRSDAPGRMQAEEVIVNGHGVQTGPARQLAASGALALDPSDGCTFWYTQHYLPLTGHATWRTRIASFKFRNCF